MSSPYAVYVSKDQKVSPSGKKGRLLAGRVGLAAIVTAVVLATCVGAEARASEPSVACGSFYGGAVSGQISVSYSWAPDRIGRSSCQEAVSVAKRAKKRLRTRNWTCRGYGRPAGRCLGLRDKYAVVIVWRPAR